MQFIPAEYNDTTIYHDDSIINYYLNMLYAFVTASLAFVHTTLTYTLYLDRL